MAVLGTRGVLAILAGVVMIGGMVAIYAGYRKEGMWTLAGGFGIASLWSIMSMYWAQSNPSATSAENYLAMTTMAVTAVIYFWYIARDEAKQS